MAGQKPTYKRSWRNLLLNKRYQLRFTLFMVGISAVLMAGLGVWVMKEANEATTVAMARIRGEACPKIPTIDAGAPSEEDGATVPLKLDDAGNPLPTPAAPAPAAGDKPAEPPDAGYVVGLWCTGQGLACPPPEALRPLAITGPDCDALVAGLLQKHDHVQALIDFKIPSVKCEGGKAYEVPKTAPEEHRVKVQIDESSMTLTPTLPPDYADKIVEHWTCELRQGGAINSLEAGRMRILWVLFGSGLVLVFGLAIYGIKMTHKVAGPLFKVQLYLAKMREGRYDKVYNLRKGDQLVDFYDHFKAAHAGVVTMEKDDIERIKAVIAAAEEAGAGDHESIKELRTVLARKEKSLE